MTGSAILLFATGYYYGGRLLFYFNVAVDHVTSSLITWNVGITGIAALYYKGPFLMQQGYLIYTSVLMAIVIEESLPEWTSWILLVLISIWDVFAVLCVVGPLRMLLETASERNEPLFPALIFSTSAWCYEVGERTASLTHVHASCSAATDAELLVVTNDHDAHTTTSKTPCYCLPDDEHRNALPSKPETSYSLVRLTNDKTLNATSALKAAALVVHPVENSSAVQLLPGVYDASNAMTSSGATRYTPDKNTTGPPRQQAQAGQNPRRFHTIFDSKVPDTQRHQAASLVPVGNSRVCGTCRQHIIQIRGAEGARPNTQEPTTDDTSGDRGMKMGLGDFIFYSVLVGKASRHGSAATVVACYMSIIVGIFLTLTLLVLLQKPLPALPLSISLGMLAYFSSVSLTEPFLEEMDSMTF
ncbi:hypothetical protein V5799_008330 [Amblyomma americanum]|uniref:Presenilin n=1 Tax=Amblyomma americanum TaxID=6943 RepID=A0AAQ4FF02_AMBAM